MKKQLLILSSLAIAGNSFSQVLLNEAFESGLPGTWSKTTLATDGGWKNGAAAALSSSNYAFSTTNATKFMGTNDDACNCNKSADRLISPSMDFTSPGNYRLSADLYFQKGTYQGKTEVGTIEISTDGGATWTVLRNLTAVEDWRVESVDLSTYAGNSDVKISFLYNDGTGWLFGMGVDNVTVFIPQPDDAKLVSTSVNRYSLINNNNTLSLNVNNNGSNAITSLEVSWNDGTAHTATIPVNIAAGASANVNHTTPVNYPTANTYDIDVVISQVNGNADSNPSDNTGSTIITTLSQSPVKKVIIEEGTGTWCGWCPRGAVAMDYMEATYPDRFIGIAVHNGDPMTVSAYDNGASFGGYPSANVDRSMLDVGVSQASFVSYYNARKDLVVPVAVAGTATASGSAVTVDVNATFYSNFPSANYRLGVIVVEDGVTGTGSGYNQVNYYANNANGAMGGYESLPSPVPAAQMVYNHVGRALLGGYNGQSGSVPTSITDGQVVNYSFTYNVPSTSNINNMHGVAVVIDNATGEIINANKIDFPAGNSGLSVKDVETIDMTVFPNPASEKLNVGFEAKGGNYTIEITDLQGRIVVSEAFTNLSGAQSIELNTSALKTGNYLISVAQEGASFTKMIAIK
ncbi:Omp28-related outer membrane protein [Crocinitomicaceae bacterium CZZ-1]|uniref:Omp28-related outer membrane protein n=1 Tax=Taishania pollutisoli TaxID=2766479 RepID=A0A8J6PI84_9FLAO|nr:Omp28-related outer membrane protein [Taishania pollutisoli]MBC9812074.1 Omp28-related outer membrane protein [Taishania pollutisoli]MBX2949850.1 Omp28-related outer membrane protein [Crocinitomicaceae bacterium]